MKFFWPTEGEISSPWGMRLHPILRYTRLHGGADIGGAVGAPIYAVADGVVTKAAQGYNGGSGNNVRIDHGQMDGQNIETSYLHMNSISVSDGQKVKKGQQIGTVGNTGLSTAPHLHFSVYVNGANSDPAPFLYAGRR
ncbi:M23 family metallopeptidase [Propioniciclava sp. MC1683]|nr:M23 family metallopeptidase [Propioniciclava sp. MC1595]MBB1500586.1 M23 family metallopeptidase [Propioniciclava sp. MC1683]NLE16941.1 M23 family metallopeptidase [Propioniciclava sp.]